jgi:hypothetical protein
MAFLNNLLELRSDAFKMTVHNRRPVPSRTDTIGPWLDALTFLTWLGALTNSALVYLFSPQLLPTVLSSANVVNATSSEIPNDTAHLVEEHLREAAGAISSTSILENYSRTSPSAMSATKELLLKAILVALVASHGFILLRLLIRHVVQKVVWTGSGEVEEREREEREVKMRFLKGGEAGAKGVVDLVGELRVDREVGVDEAAGGGGEEDGMGFWEHDEGVEEIQRISKEA